MRMNREGCMDGFWLLRVHVMSSMFSHESNVVPLGSDERWVGMYVLRSHVSSIDSSLLSRLEIRRCSLLIRRLWRWW